MPSYIYRLNQGYNMFNTNAMFKWFWTIFSLVTPGGCEKSWVNGLVLWFIHILTVHLQQLRGMQSSKLGTWKGLLALPTEGLTKGYLFCQKWYIKEQGIGPRGGSSLYKPLLRTPGTSFFAEFLKTPCSYTEQGEIFSGKNKISIVNQCTRNITGHF